MYTPIIITVLYLLVRNVNFWETKVINQFKYVTQIIHLSMRFLDVHPMKGLDESLLKELQNAPVDEFGIRHLNILFNPEVDRCFCLIEAPTMEAVHKHHDKFGITIIAN